MALYENKITLKGFLGRDAAIFSTRNHTTFVTLSVATKSGYKDKKTKQWVNKTEWHRVVAFGKPADYAKDLTKGDYVEIEGEQRSTEYEEDVIQGTNKVRVTFRDKEVHASIVKKLAAPKAGENPDAETITEDDAA